ncbi:MAG TPA: S4 domain-containing protein, partial [Sphingomonadales bacterium]|nr:S4 domain-containing protein [Sphingomonadales bacterium]
YWQFWRNTRDEDVGRFLRLFTEFPLSEIKRLELLQGEELNEAKTILANEATALCRGRKAAEKAAGAMDSPDALPIITIPLRERPAANTEYLVAAGICESKNQARQLILQGGIQFNERKIANPVAKDFSDGITVVRKGKKSVYRVKIG